MPQSGKARCLFYPSHGPELERWAILLWRGAGYLSPLVRSPGYLPEPLLAPSRASGLNAAVLKPSSERGG